MSRILTIYRRALFALVVATVAVLLAIMGAQIVFRYGFNASLIWAEELCRYLLIWLSFIALAASYERGECATVTLLRDALPRSAGLVLAITANTLGAVLLILLAYYGLSYAARIGGSSIPAVQFIFNDLFGPGVAAPAIYWVYVALPVGLVLLSIRLVADIVTYLRLLLRGGTASDLRGGPRIGDA